MFRRTYSRKINRGWETVTIPHDWSVREQLSPTLASCTGYLPGGIGWYRKTLNVPATKQGEKSICILKEFITAVKFTLMATCLEERPNGYISFAYDATPYIKYGEDNVIAVRVDHSQSADSRWYTGSGIDYLGESGAWPSRGFYSGLLDFGGFPKPRGYFRQSLWSDKPMAYLGTYPTPGAGQSESLQDVWSALNAENNNKKEKTPSMDAWAKWNYTEGQSIRVVCYTNGSKAKLLLNNKQVGEVKNYDDNTGIIYWDIPYTKGELKVISMNESGDEVAQYSIETTKQPAKITASADVQIIDKERGVAQVTVLVTDENGNKVMLSDNEIKCQIAGPARLLGLEGSNNSDMGDYTDNKQRVFNGRLLAYVQATGKGGEIMVRFTSPWLEEAVVALNAE